MSTFQSINAEQVTITDYPKYDEFTQQEVVTEQECQSITIEPVVIPEYPLYDEIVDWNV
jgi:hypothetical protein